MASDAQTEAAAVAEITRQGAGATRVDPDGTGGRILVSVGPAGTIHVADLEPFMDAPMRKTGLVTVFDTTSFIAYVKAHVETLEELPALYGDWQARKIVGVLDDHGEERPGRGAHRVTLCLRATPEWNRWMALDNKLSDQDVFAQHIEDGLAEIIEPAAADLLEIAQSFHASTSARFDSDRRLTSGQVQFSYHEETTALAGRDAQLEVPAEFKVALAPFEGADPYAMVARLRYRITGGTLRVGYKLAMVDDVVKKAFDDVGKLVQTQTGRAVLAGTPR